MPDDTPPERVRIPGKGCLPRLGSRVRRCLYHDQLQIGINQDHLAVHTEEGKAPFLAREYPELVTVAIVGSRPARVECLRDSAPIRAIQL